MKVLVGIDGSQKSIDALRFATRLLEPAEDTVVLYYRPPEVHISGEAELVPSIPTDLKQRLVADVFDKAREMLPSDFQARMETIDGETRKPADGLLLAAEQIGADLMVVGADAKRRSLGPFLGGIAQSGPRRSRSRPGLSGRPRAPGGQPAERHPRSRRFRGGDVRRQTAGSISLAGRFPGNARPRHGMDRHSHCRRNQHS